jgi:hypothetical protein
MNAERVVAVVVVCIVGLTLATGPLGPLDIDADSGSIEDPGTGSATVEVVSAPGAVELVPSDDGQELLYLSVPTTTVRTSNVTGNPALSYRLSLTGTGLSIEALRFPAEAGEEELELVIDRRVYQPRAVENVTGAELSVTLRGENQTTVFERTVPVERP